MLLQKPGKFPVPPRPYQSQVHGLNMDHQCREVRRNHVYPPRRDACQLKFAYFVANSVLISPPSPTNSVLLTFAYAEAQNFKKEYDAHPTFDKLPTTPKFRSSAPLPLNQSRSSSQTLRYYTSSSLEHSGKQETTAFTKYKAEYRLACIRYMRFARTEGVKASRAVYCRSRNDPWAP